MTEKRCPKCKRKYVEEDLNYCLADGTFLLTPGEMSPGEAAPTLRIQDAPTEALPPRQTSIDAGPRARPRTNPAWLWLTLGGLLFIALLVSIPTAYLIVRSSGKSRLDVENTNENSGSQNTGRPLASPMASPGAAGPPYMSPSPSSSSPLNLRGTAWAGTDSTGVKYQFDYLSDGRLRYTSNGNIYETGNEWSQLGTRVTMNINGGYSRYEGIVNGERIDFKASNRQNFNWTITVTRIR